MSSLLIFVIFLGPLIFFHELGHFLFAKFFGVRVETFSIGFGPKILKYKKGDTTYAISAIPLGGYVKMFGDNILERDQLPEEERKYAFTHKTKWQRFWIVFGGPLANFILTFVIFFALSLTGEKVPEPSMGVVTPGSETYKYGFREGDVIKSINNVELSSLTDFISSGVENVDRVVVERSGKDVSLNLNLTVKEFIESIMAVPNAMRAPYLRDIAGETWALSFSAGALDKERKLSDYIFSTSPLFLIGINTGSETEVLIDEKRSRRLEYNGSTEKDFYAFLKSQNLYPVDLTVKSIVLDSPAEKSGITAGDIITSFNGVNIVSFEQLRESVQRVEKGSRVQLGLVRGEERRMFDIVPVEKEVSKNVFVKSIGVFSGGIYNQPKLVNTNGLGLIDSISRGVTRTWESIVTTLVGFKSLITGDVSLKTVGGPIAIAKVASDSFNISISYFLKIMALISVNLGIINLFPIPVLDGGHIVFIFLELIRGQPVSKRVVEVALQFGVSVLFILIFFAIFNDISRLMN